MYYADFQMAFHEAVTNACRHGLLELIKLHLGMTRRHYLEYTSAASMAMLDVCKDDQACHVKLLYVRPALFRIHLRII